MEHLNVIFEKGSSKVSSKKTYNEYQNFAPVDGFDIYGQWLLRGWLTTHVVASSIPGQKLRVGRNCLVWVIPWWVYGGMAEWRKNCLQILEDGMAEDCPKSLRWNSGKLPQILNDRTINSTRRSHGSIQTLACYVPSPPNPPLPPPNLKYNSYTSSRPMFMNLLRPQVVACDRFFCRCH